MVTKKLLKGYGFTTKGEYYEMILTSRINGQLTQSATQFRRLNKDQRLEFFYWLNSTPNFNEELFFFLKIALLPNFFAKGN